MSTEVNSNHYSRKLGLTKNIKVEAKIGLMREFR